MCGTFSRGAAGVGVRVDRLVAHPVNHAPRIHLAMHSLPATVPRTGVVRRGRIAVKRTGGRDSVCGTFSRRAAGVGVPIAAGLAGTGPAWPPTRVAGRHHPARPWRILHTLCMGMHSLPDTVS